MFSDWHSGQGTLFGVHDNDGQNTALEFELNIGLYDNSGNILGTLVFSFVGSDIFMESEYHRFTIEKPNFNYYPDISYIDGVKGNIKSVINNKHLGNIEFSLKSFTIDLRLSKIVANEVVLNTNKIQISNQQCYPLMLNLKRTYYKNDILILGEGLHTVHPVAGQGFNLVLRDINKLQKIFKYYTELGMSLKTTPALEEFTNNRKSENIITGIGIDLTHNFFKQNKLLDPFKETILKNISKNDTLKKISKFISNQGLSI